ncbi:MAG: class I SAM-dependent RNA methyltransferase, partial [Pseudomonadota bacterium]
DALPSLAELIPLAASRSSEVRLTLTLTEGGVDVAVEGAKELDGPGRALLAGAANRAGLARLSWNGEPAVTRCPPHVAMGRAKVTPPPGGFLQATADGAAALVAAVREAVAGAGAIGDLFAGSGTFSLPLAEDAEIHAVESQAEALEALDRGWREAPGLKRITTERRDLAHRPLRPEELTRFDAVVVDPPRAGARLQAEHLAKSGVARIAMVSCNPATFARDARLLIDGGFGLDWVKPVDQFRWSGHVELAAQFTRAHR